MLRNGMLIGVAIAAAACADGGSGDSPSPSPPSPPRPYPQSDQQIAELIYSAGPRTPQGFYVDPIPPGASYVTTTHLKDTDISTAGNPVRVHELCTEDWSQALDWSETAATQSPAYADLVETNGEARYFEFVRVPRDVPSARARQRVFRCSYVDRTGADARSLEGAGGRINHRPLAIADVQQLAEYLWYFTAFNNFGNVVLTSAPDAARGPLAHSLTIAALTRASSAANCDRIDIVRWTHAADAATGVLDRSVTTLATLHARETPGLVALCEAP